MKEFYTAKEACEKLEVTEDTFQYMVQKNQVKKVILSGRKYGVYPQEDIDELTKIFSQFNLQSKDHPKDLFRVARQEDASAMYELSERIMRLSGGQGIYADRLLPFLCVPHSEIGHVLIRNNELIGYFTIIPLTHSKLMQRMNEETTIGQIRSEELASFEAGQSIDCFIWEVISDPMCKYAGAYLIEKMLKFFHTLGKRGVHIEGIYALASSPEGIHLCRRMGMHMMDLPKRRMHTEAIPFELKVQEQKNWLTKNYIQALRSYKIKQERLHAYIS